MSTTSMQVLLKSATVYKGDLLKINLGFVGEHPVTKTAIPLTRLPKNSTIEIFQNSPVKKPHVLAMRLANAADAEYAENGRFLFENWASGVGVRCEVETEVSSLAVYVKLGELDIQQPPVAGPVQITVDVKCFDSKGGVKSAMVESVRFTPAPGERSSQTPTPPQNEDSIIYPIKMDLTTNLVVPGKVSA